MSGGRPGRTTAVLLRAFKEDQARKRAIIRHGDEIRTSLESGAAMLALVLADPRFIALLGEEGLATLPRPLERRLAGPPAEIET